MLLISITRSPYLHEIISTHLEFDPHTQKYGGGVHHQPDQAQAEQHQAGLLVAKQDPQQDHKGRKDPDDEDPLVENVVEGEAHVGGELLQTAHVLLHRQLKGLIRDQKGMENSNKHYYYLFFKKWDQECLEKIKTRLCSPYDPHI